MGRKIIHIDMDAFYASVEQRDDVRLRGRPIAVVDARGWGIVATASYEARATGVRAGTPITAAKQLCPGLIVVEARMPVYESISEDVKSIAASYTPLVEPVMLDEVYLDVTDNADFATATALAIDLRRRIREELGLVVSAGVSYNKLLAKLASDESKPNGLLVIRPADGARRVEGLPVEKLHGVGAKTLAKMHGLGITTALELRQRARDELVGVFGVVAGGYFHDIARGIDDRPVKVPGPPQSLGVEQSFKTSLRTDDDKDDGLRLIAGLAWEKCARHDVVGRTVSVRLRYADFSYQMRTRTVAQALSTRAALEAMCFEVRATLPPSSDDVRSIGVSVSGFVTEQPTPSRQLSLLA